jgi:hypothetical protein
MLAGRFYGAGCPVDVSNVAVRVIEVKVIAATGPDGHRASSEDARAAMARDDRHR